MYGNLFFLLLCLVVGIGGTWLALQPTATAGDPDRLAGGLDILDLAKMGCETFETWTDAESRLREPHPWLGGKNPLTAAQTPAGAERVKGNLIAIKYGAVA